MYINQNAPATPVRAKVIPKENFLQALSNACKKVDPAFGYTTMEEFMAVPNNPDTFGLDDLPSGLDNIESVYTDVDSLENEDIPWSGKDCLGLYTTEKGVTVLNIAVMSPDAVPFPVVITLYVTVDGNCAVWIPHVGNPVNLQQNAILYAYDENPGDTDNYLARFNLTEEDVLLNGDALSKEMEAGLQLA